MARKNEATAVENLQRYLRQLSYHESITPPPIDGVFEAKTAKALEEFQSLYGLPVTGVATQRTWDALYNAYRASLTAGTPPRAVLILPSSVRSAPLSEGSTLFAVSVLQYMLRELSALYTPLEKIELTGVYDGATTAAIKDFQSKNRLPVTGEVDIPTWNTVTDQYNILFSTEGIE